MTLHEIAKKCKSEETFMAMVVILVGIGAFGLGRLSKIEAGRQRISIEAPANVAGVVNAENSALNADLEPLRDISDPKTPTGDSADIGSPGTDSSGQVVASKNGTKYYFPWCGGAKNISEKNLVTFPSTEAARTAGYAPAGNCKGLK